MGRRRIIRTEEQIEWFKENYPMLTNTELSNKLGMSRSTIALRAKEYGLSKSVRYGERVSQLRSRAMKAYHQSHPHATDHLMAACKYSRFQKGQNVRMRYGEEVERIRQEKSRAAILKLRKAEKARVAFGLPQKTKYKIAAQDLRKLHYKYYLQRKGYIVDDEKRTIYYSEKTKRALRAEQRDQPWYKFQAIS